MEECTHNRRVESYLRTLLLISIKYSFSELKAQLFIPRPSACVVRTVRFEHQLTHVFLSVPFTLLCLMSLFY